MNLYLADILDQPRSLRLALKQLDLADLDPIRQAVASRRIDRIVLTGMGASFFALYPAWVELAAAGLPAIWVDSAELVHHAPALINDRTLTCIASQSGRSAEVVSLLGLMQARRPGGLIAITNDPSSPLGQTGQRGDGGLLHALLELHAVPEQTPSTRTYLNMMAIGLLAALALDPAGAGPDRLETAWSDLEQTAAGLEAYTADWENELRRIKDIFSAPACAHPESAPFLVLLGRGPSLASACTGALCLQEVVKLPALGLQAAQFRHGPLEIARPGLPVWIFAGQPGSHAAELNRNLWNDLRRLEVNAQLLAPLPAGSRGAVEDGLLPIPASAGIGLPLAEILPVQLLAYSLSLQAGITPGAFNHIGKVTLSE